jgi:hypothetical protein
MTPIREARRKGIQVPLRRERILRPWVELFPQAPLKTGYDGARSLAVQKESLFEITMRFKSGGRA